MSLPAGEVHAQAQAEKPKPPKLSGPVRKKLQPAQQAFDKGDFDTALTLAQEALALAKEPDDTVISLQILRAASARKNDLMGFAKYSEQLLALDALTGDERKKTEENLARIYFQQKDYAKSRQWATRWVEGGGGAAALEVLAATYLIENDCKNGIGPFEKSLEGREPTEQQLRTMNTCYLQLEDKAKRRATLETLVTRFQKREYFIDLLNSHQDAQADSRAVLNLYRLGLDRNWLWRESDLVEFAIMALDAGAPAEAEKVLEFAQKSGSLSTSTNNQQLQRQAKQLAAEDRKTIAALDKEARGGKNGEADVKVGLAYIGLGEYQKAVDAIRRGLQPDRVARVRRLDDAWMTLGIALSRLGNTAEAAKAFEQAKTDARMAPAADLWLKVGPTVAAAPAPAATAGG
ncbi:MAG: tetratricopeptide repeat protein [Steroidobacteraceae bacterium]|nr:tetratricopeptide repeat protein [Steroidobacteraceae bacterium]